MRDNHLYASYAIVPPQIDRSKPAHKQSDPTLYAGVVKERDDGIVISGAQQLATGGVLSDYIHLSCIHPLQPGDENYANCVAVPVSAAASSSIRAGRSRGADSSFDYPLSSRFDESDATSCSTTCSCRGSTSSSTATSNCRATSGGRRRRTLYGNHQAQVRYVTKLRFMMGLAQRMNEMTGNAAQPPVQIMMGELAALATDLRNHAAGARDRGADQGRRAVAVSRHALFGDGAAIGIQRPHARDRSASSPARRSSRCRRRRPISTIRRSPPIWSATCARRRPTPRRAIALMRLIWDFLGSEFGSRHAQYEKFYGGARSW